MEEVEGQVVVKADKRDLLRGRRAPAVLQVNLPTFSFFERFLLLKSVAIFIPLSQVEVNEDEEGMVVIGGGAAGHTAVETLRFPSLIPISQRWLFLQERGFPRPNLTGLQGASPAL